MTIFAKNSFSRTCMNATVVLTIILTAFANALTQSINSLDIDRGNLQYLLNVLRPEPSLRVVVQSAGKEPRELKIDAKIQQTKRITDLTNYDEVARLDQEGQ